MPYCNSLTDSEWEIIEPILHDILPRKKLTRPCNWTKREILDGIFYQLKNGCNWQDLPKDLPPLFHCILALQAVANTGSDRRADEAIT
ncbi:transposase [Lyngbya sp. CCAP 1446/10]|uniref:transposase n=1 Tax=Microcoleaceae TaxID=1892252 RepID=UPI0035C92FDB|nr:transposase [Lyngbya sp. CCAP 1446/10]